METTALIFSILALLISVYCFKFVVDTFDKLRKEPEPPRIDKYKDYRNADGLLGRKKT